jgi:hypothetical protein
MSFATGIIYSYIPHLGATAAIILYTLIEIPLVIGGGLVFYTLMERPFMISNWPQKAKATLTKKLTSLHWN